MLRTISELQAAFQHRVTLLEQNFRELARQQHDGFADALERKRWTCRSACGATWKRSAASTKS